jgi:hypothetical protein
MVAIPVIPAPLASLFMGMEDPCTPTIPNHSRLLFILIHARTRTHLHTQATMETAVLCRNWYRCRVRMP